MFNQRLPNPLTVGWQKTLPIIKDSVVKWRILSFHVLVIEPSGQKICTGAVQVD
jgi:hypothetical protein